MGFSLFRVKLEIVGEYRVFVVLISEVSKISSRYLRAFIKPGCLEVNAFIAIHTHSVAYSADLSSEGCFAMVGFILEGHLIRFIVRLNLLRFTLSFDLGKELLQDI
mmetsp:Transcript_24289/g.37494  ORF Transcript_24289/g.37494 Transcript_24289/m.37494 type:complete len:106 (-) Transcript_24289:2522-2839(-)